MAEPSQETTRMPECAQCARKTQLHLCGACETELRDMLLGLAVGWELPNGKHAPGWLEFLEDAALGRTRLGESARRSSDHTTPLPVHIGASDLLDSIQAMLTQWIELLKLHTSEGMP